MKQEIENIIKKILSEDKGLPLGKLNGNLLERALGTMNFQLKQSIGREEITSISDKNVLTEEDVKEINKIIITEKSSLIADEVLKVVEENWRTFILEKWSGRLEIPNKYIDELLSNLSTKENKK